MNGAKLWWITTYLTWNSTILRGKWSVKGECLLGKTPQELESCRNWSLQKFVIMRNWGTFFFVPPFEVYNPTSFDLIPCERIAWMVDCSINVVPIWVASASYHKSKHPAFIYVNADFCMIYFIQIYFQVMHSFHWARKLLSHVWYCKNTAVDFMEQPPTR